jgi:regulator of nucleoside diphosphate kinase
MATDPPCQLTTKDHAILRTMLDRHRGGRGPYLALLQRKVRDSAVVFRDDIPACVVTLNTRLTYRVDGVLAGPALIVQSPPEDLPAFALSIHTLHGLALLGMTRGCPLDIGLGPSSRETLVVERIWSQPEAEMRLRAACCPT